MEALFHVLIGALALCSHCAAAVATCPGSVDVAGYGRVDLVNAEWNVPGEPAGPVDVVAAQGEVVIQPGMKGRTYFAGSCVNNSYAPSRYVALPLLGKTLRYTMNLSGAGCGCNAALYLTPLRQSRQPAGCMDYYCDANSVCGARCSEIDVQEANTRAWHSTLHVPDDSSGISAGYGGGDNWSGNRDWTRQEYGPGATCIDTTKAFQVAASFPTNSQGQLHAMNIQLSQPGSPCKLSVSVGGSGYRFEGRNGMQELADDLRAGMTPIISYWSSANMLWLDGPGADSLGPCRVDDPSACAAVVSFSNFSLDPAVLDDASEVHGRQRLRGAA